MVKSFWDKFWKFGINFVIFLSLFLVLVNAVVLQPGVDADITYNDSSKGIWWSEMNIYAKTGISVGDIIEMSYNASNSSNTDLYPMTLKVKDVDTIICVNELLDNIAPYISYPICFYNNDPYHADTGFNYSVRESQSLFTTKSYDIEWGKPYQKEKLSNLNFSSLNSTATSNSTHYLLNQYQKNLDLSTIGSYTSGLVTKFGSAPLTNAANMVDQNYGTYGYIGTYGGSSAYYAYAGKIFPSTYITSFRIQLQFIATSGGGGHGGGGYVQTYDGSTWNTVYTEPYANQLNVLRNLNINVNGNIQGIRGYVYGGGADGSNTLYVYEIEPHYNAYYEVGNISTDNLVMPYSVSQLDLVGIDENFSNSNITYKLHLDNGSSYTFSNKVLSQELTSGSTFNIEAILQSSNELETPFISKNFQYSLTPSNIKITKESDDNINGVNLIPFQTNSNLISFLTIEALNTSTLYFDLNNLDSAVLTNNLNDYLVEGDNYLVINQVNNDGGFWMFFEGQYNTPPTLSPGPTLNTSEDLELGQSIYCNAGVYSDLESDPQSGIEFGWWKNNVKQAPTTQALNIATISAVKNDLIKCGERVNDGASWSNWHYTNELTVIGAKPTGNISLSPSSPSLGQDVTCIIDTLADADADNVTANIQWFVNSTTLLSNLTVNMSGGNLTLSNTNISSSSSYSCIVTLDDSTTQVNKTQSFSFANIAPTITRGLTLDTNYAYDDYISSDIGCLATDINENDTITYIYEYSTDKVNWSTITSTTGTSLTWDISSLPEDDYFIRCKANDGTTDSSYSDMAGNVTFKDYAITTLTNTDNFYSLRFTVASGSAILNDQYDNGNTGYLAGDSSVDKVYSIINYLSDKFDGERRFTKYEIKPNLAYVGDDSLASGTLQNYDILLYEVDTIGTIPSGTPISAYYDATLKVGQRNSFEFNVVPSANKYIAVKVCKNVNEITNECNPDFNGATDAIVVKGKSSGSYLSKVDQGSGSYSNAYNLDVKFDWEREPLEKVKVMQNINFPDNMVPLVIVKRGSGDYICGTSKVAIKKGIPECIKKITGTKYYIYTEHLESGVQYDILGGPEIQFSSAGGKTLTITKNSIISDSVKMTILGNEYSGGYTTSPQLLVNSQNVWSTSGEFSSEIDTNPLTNILITGSNTFYFTSNSNGELIFWMEPVYTNLDVTHATSLAPIEDALATLDVAFTTTLAFDTTKSYCAFKKNGLLKTKASISGTAGSYTCKPSLESSDAAGQYNLVVHIEDSTGYSDEYEGIVSYSSLKAITIEDIDFGTMDYNDEGEDRVLTINVELKNTGNVDISELTLKAKLDKFWNDKGEYGFAIDKILHYSFSDVGLLSSRDRKKFNVLASNDMLIDTSKTKLTPGDSQSISFELDMTDVNVPVDEYIGEMEVTFN